MSPRRVDLFRRALRQQGIAVSSVQTRRTGWRRISITLLTAEGPGWRLEVGFEKPRLHGRPETDVRGLRLDGEWRAVRLAAARGWQQRLAAILKGRLLGL